jgi:hypothetical protein
MQNLAVFSNTPQQRQHRFILNMKRSDDQELDSIIKQLKARRSFTRAIRIGLLLFWSLMNGQTDILLREFPWVLDRLQTPKLQEQLNRIEERLNQSHLEAHKPLESLEVGQRHLNPVKALSEDDLLDKLEVKQKTPQSGVEKEYYGWVLNWKLWLTSEDNNIDRCLLKFGDTALRWGIRVGALPTNAFERQAELLAAQAKPGGAAQASRQLPGNAKLLANAPQELPPPEDLALDLL